MPTPAQQRATAKYIAKNRVKINDRMIGYYENNKEDIKRKRRERYQRQKQANDLEKLEQILSKDTIVQ